MPEEISADDPFPRSRARVRDAELAYVDVGGGSPIVFLHGNPTSSYLWRNVLPHVQHLGRCLAPDLIGMGESAKLPRPGPGTYSFATHAAYLEAWLETVLPSGPVVLVLHEAIVSPLTWADWPAGARKIFRTMRGPDGEAAVLGKNVFVERILPASTLRGLSPEAHERYRAPFRSPEDRWPTLEWPRQLPIENVPPRVHDVVARYGQWLAHSDVPKLFLNAEPGSILVGRQRGVVRKWPALTEVTVPGNHFVPEDSPHEIGRALAAWIPTLR
jgi:haloalkane dehalogenase